MKRYTLPFAVALSVLVSASVGYVFGLVAVSDQPDPTAAPATYRLAAIAEPANLDALLESKANTDPVLAWLRLNASGTPYLQWRAIYSIVTPTPKPSATPVVDPGSTASSTPPPTNTPRPTATYTPTRTPTRKPTITRTPTDEDEFATPTPEDEIPTNEPTAPPANDKTCELKVIESGGIRVRREPTRSAVQVGYAIYPEQPTIDEFKVVQYREPSPSTRVYDELWAHILIMRSTVKVEGWTVVVTKLGQADVDWWTAGVTGHTEICQDVAGWPQGLAVPEPIVEAAPIMVGWHTIQGVNASKLASTLSDYSAIKTTDLTKDLGPWFKSVNPDGYWIHRSIFGENGAMNCPASEWEWYQPQMWIDRFVRTWPAGADAYEYINECGTGPNAAAFVDFNITAMEYMNKKGYCSLAFSFAAGVPDYPEWPAILPVLKWIDNHPCRTVNGKPVMNGVALHGSFCSKDYVPGNDWVNWLDLCDRHRIISDRLLEWTGYDWRKSPMVIAITEDGWDGGRGGTDDDPAITTDFAMGTINYSLDMYEAENLVDVIIVWNLGTGGSNWIDRWYFIEPLAALLRSRALE